MEVVEGKVVVVVVDDVVDDVDDVDDDEEGEGGGERRRRRGEGEGEEDAQRRKSNNPNLKGGEKPSSNHRLNFSLVGSGLDLAGQPARYPAGHLVGILPIRPQIRNPQKNMQFDGSFVQIRLFFDYY